ncbi:hypothetical protein [Kitasatospora griseola]|uniref:hypothetical protein n=1 Tax=Kitasatospora griseola TaxID=2064 RepID=UPI00382643DA
MTARTCLPIIGNLRPRPDLSDAYTATEPIGVAELREVIRSRWCLSCRTIDGPSTTSGCGTYHLIAEIDGHVLVVTGQFAGVR